LLAPSATFSSDNTCAFVKSSTLPVAAVIRPFIVAVGTVFKSAFETTFGAIVVTFPNEVTSPVKLALVVTVDAVVAVAAFPPILKLATGVVEVTTKGAVPVATVEVNCVPERFPEAATEVGVIAPRVNVMAGVVDGVATDPLIPLAVATDKVVTDPPAKVELNIPPTLKFNPLPTVISEALAVAAVGLPNNLEADTVCILAYVTLFAPMVVALPTEVTSPVKLALVVTVDAVVAVVAFPATFPVRFPVIIPVKVGDAILAFKSRAV